MVSAQAGRRDVNRYVSERLRQIRLERGLSQTEAGRRLSQFSAASWRAQAVSRAELCKGTYTKRWNVDDLYDLAEAFEVPVSFFLPVLDASRSR